MYTTYCPALEKSIGSISKIMKGAYTSTMGKKGVVPYYGSGSVCGVETAPNLKCVTGGWKLELL